MMGVVVLQCLTNCYVLKVSHSRENERMRVHLSCLLHEGFSVCWLSQLT